MGVNEVVGRLVGQEVRAPRDGKTHVSGGGGGDGEKEDEKKNQAGRHFDVNCISRSHYVSN